MKVLSFLALVFLSVTHGHNNDGSNNAHQLHGYRFGAPVRMECRTNVNTTWTSNTAITCVTPTLVKSLFELDTFKFGVDAFYQCHWAVSKEQIPFMTACINRDESLRCRALMVPGHDFWIPFDVPIWGVVEATHIHIDNHVNFVFHAARGSLLAAAAYPIRDQFAFVDKNSGGVVNLHGHIKFFTGESYVAATASNNFAFLPGDDRVPNIQRWSSVLTVFLWCLITMVITGFGALLYFIYRVQPNYVRKLESKVD